MELTATQRETRILVVDDEEAVADLYATWLDERFDVTSAYDGDRALDLVGDDVDVVFLDRQMPGHSGDEVLETIADRDLDCRVVLVTAVDPDFDVLEMPFDDYLTKPVTREELLGAVDDMVQRDAYDEQVDEYVRLVTKKATLERQKNPAELEDERYEAIERRIEELRADVDTTVAELDSPDALFDDLSDEPLE